MRLCFTKDFVVFVKFGDHTEETGVPEDAHFLPIPLTSTTFWRVLMAFSRTGSTDCMIPSLLSISLICGCMPSMAFIFLATSTSGCPSSSLLRILAVRDFWMFLMAAVLATAASPSPLASEERADERVEERLTRSSSSFMWSYWLAATVATRAQANFISRSLIIKNYQLIPH